MFRSRGIAKKLSNFPNGRFLTRSCSGKLWGSAEEYAKLGVHREQVLKLKEAYASGATVEEASNFVTEHMVKTYYAAGKPEEVRDQIIELVAAAGRLGYDHVAFAKLGPNYEEAINLLADQVVPALR